MVLIKKGFSYLASYLLILLRMFLFICLFNQIISKQALAEKDCAGLYRGSNVNERNNGLEAKGRLRTAPIPIPGDGCANFWRRFLARLTVVVNKITS